MQTINAVADLAAAHLAAADLVDVVLALGVLAMAIIRLGGGLSVTRLAAFLVAISSGIIIVYSILLPISVDSAINPLLTRKVR